MSNPVDPIPTVLPAPEPPPARKGWTKLSWAVILTVVGLIVAAPFLPLPIRRGGELESTDNPVVLRIIGVQFRLYVALNSMPGNDTTQLWESAQKLNQDGAGQRLRFIVVAGELKGPEEAMARLHALEEAATNKQVTLNPQQQKVWAVLTALYSDLVAGKRDLPSVSRQDRELLEQRLSWFGRLAQHPPVPAGNPDAAARDELIQEAQLDLLVLAGAGLGALLLLIAGLAGMLTFFLLWLGGKVHVGLPRGVAHGGVYAETFALWLVTYVGLTVVGMLFFGEEGLLTRGVVAMLLSLGVLAWPVARGIPWGQVRQDIGWTLGRQPPLEPFLGIVCYTINFPLVAVGFLVTLLLLLVQSLAQQGLAGEGGSPGGAAPTHPVLQVFSDPDALTVVQIFFLLSVVAPVVEETMFRGVLHRHLREARFPGGNLLNGLFSAVVVNFIFAVIHPQGLATVPVLMALAFGFSLAREWRGTLIPGIVGHGLNNGLVALLALLLLARGA